MRESDKDLIEASKHYRIAECGRLERISTPYKAHSRTKMGIGFDHLNTSYMKFAHTHKKGGKQCHILSHRMVYYLHHGVIPDFIDHIDRDRCNNLVSNLRAATSAQNSFNRRSNETASSKLKGVSPRKNRWVAKIEVSKKQIHLGSFKTEVEAAKAYDAAAVKYFGEFANLNLPTTRDNEA